ncbi:hypothetical protein LINPERPRIM_LOCUS41105 [Linum perenne]
MNLAEKF